MKSFKFKKLGIANLALIFLLLFACNSNKKQGGLEGNISIDGSSTVYPITEAVAEEFFKKNTKVKIAVGESGTGGGFKKFARGESDINNASRAIKNEEIEMCKASNINYVEILVGYDGMAIMVNPKNNWVENITVAELKRIWEPEAQGKIMRWNQIRPEWPDKEIHLYGAGTASGTFDYFTEAIVGKAKSCRGDYTASEDDNVLVQGISSDELALGFFGLSYYENNTSKLKLIAVDDENPDNGNGPILPSLETVKDKTYSPLSRPLYIYVNSKAAEKEAVQEFVKFYIENCINLTQSVGYIPISTEELATVNTKWDEFIKLHSAVK